MPSSAAWQQHLTKYGLVQETAWEEDTPFPESLYRLFHQEQHAAGVCSTWNATDDPCQAQQPSTRGCFQMSQKYLRFIYSQRHEQAGWFIDPHIHPSSLAFPRSNSVLMSTHANLFVLIEEKSNLISVRNTTVLLNFMILMVFSNLHNSVKWLCGSKCNNLGYKLPCWAV